MRKIPLLLLSVLLCACGGSKPRPVEQGPGPMHKEFPEQNLPASNNPVPVEPLGPPAKPAANAAILLDTPSPMTDTPPAPNPPVKPAANAAVPPDTPPPVIDTPPPVKPAANATVPSDTPPPITDTPPLSISPPSGKIEVLGEMSSATPGASTATTPCNHYNCATILSIKKHHGLEDFTPGVDNGPGTYFATDIPEGNAVAQPQDSGEVFEKESTLWDITVQMQDGTVQTMQQDNAPGVQVGDSVLIEGNTITPWN